MDKKSKKANEIFMKQVNNKLVKKGWDGTSKLASRKRNETEKNIGNVYDRGDSTLYEHVKDSQISIDNLMEDIQLRTAMKMGLNKRKEMEKSKTVSKNNNITPKRTNEKAEESHLYRLSDSKERKKILDRYTFKLKDNNNNNFIPIIVNKDENKRLNEMECNKTGERKKPLEKYTFKLKGESHYVSNGGIIVNREDTKRKNDITECCFKTADKYFAKKQINLELPSKKFESINLEIKTDKNNENKGTATYATKIDIDKDVMRKPIIKTIASKNDTKVYKAVSFANKKKRTQLHINMPSDNKTGLKPIRESSSRQSSGKQRENLSESKIENSKTSIKDKAKKKKAEKKENISIDYSEADVMQTEVAMWAPSSVDPHTQPYYDAWVDKTLTAISRLSEDDEAYKKNIFVTPYFKESTRPESPELIYANYKDERYTGRIKVTQR